jgi:acyl-CoA synthetase (AMP-forming)/AMP-acid ligase II
VHAFVEAGRDPGGVTFVGLDEREAFLPWGAVVERARRAAGALADLGIEPGDRVAIVLRTEPAFLDAFLGAWLCGAVPVPLYPPVRLGRMEEYLAATARMLAVSGARAVVSAGGARRLLGAAVERAHPPLGCVDAARLLAAAPAAPRLPAPGELGLVQFSSGSTVDPRPVALTHGALQAMVDALVVETAPDRARDALLCWLPLYHDMGLIGGLLGPATYPGPLVLIAPEHFLARPALWPRAMARHGATICAAPSFAYAYVADRVRPVDLAGLSLARWRLALDGAEPISASALRRFAGALAPHGFDARALRPVYGLSEAALAVTFARPGASPFTVREVDPVRLARDGVVARGGRAVVSVGTPVSGVEVELRTPSGAPAGEGRLGRIWVRGPALMQGYLGDPAGTAAALQGGWLDTGDLGFVAGGELYLHGRAKDVVIVRGANHAPEEFEAPLVGVPGLRPGCAVALGRAAEGGGEELWILAERARDAREDDDGALAAAAAAAVTGATGVAPRAVHVLAPGSLPRTSSGKLRRGEARRRLEAGTLDPPARVTPLRLAVQAARSQLAFRRARRKPAPAAPGDGDPGR